MSLPRFDLVLPELDFTLRLPRLELAAALSAWCTARWLPAEPLQFDPAWLKLSLPQLPMPQVGLSVLLGLVQARAGWRATLGIDIARPEVRAQLARIVATLNLRLPALRLGLGADPRPWAQLALVLHHAETIRLAAPMIAAQMRLGLQASASLSVGLGLPLEWRQLAAQIKLLAPLIAIGAAAEIDFSLPGAAMQLSQLVLQLKLITLPALVDLEVVMQLVARADAIGRIQLALGFDPLTLPFHQVCAAVELRLAAALALLPDVRLAGGILVGLPNLAPSFSVLLNPAMVQASLRLNAAVLAKLNWQVPGFAAFDLLQVGAPVLALMRALGTIGIDPIALRPCAVCDLASAMRGL